MRVTAISRPDTISGYETRHDQLICVATGSKRPFADLRVAPNRSLGERLWIVVEIPGVNRNPYWYVVHTSNLSLVQK